jgi:MFS family permease
MLAGVIVQSYVGHRVDGSERKRTLSAIAALAVTAGCIGIIVLPSMWMQCLVQAVIGIAITVFPAATSAFAMGMTPEEERSKRIGRNETFTHGGNVVFAVIAGVVGQFLAVAGIFIEAAAFATGMAGASYMIRGKDVDQEAAREGGGDAEKQPSGFRTLWQDKRILIFTAAVVLFNVGNAATLPLVGQLLSKQNKSASVWQTAACVVVAEIVMVAVAAYIGKRADAFGRKPLFLVGFAVLALRNGITPASHNQWYLISLQSLDGVAAAIYGVMLTVVAADLAKGTGRFNFLQGAVQSAMGLGGFLSNSFFGWIAKALSFNASFFGLAAAAAAGGILYYFKMPETQESKQPHRTDHPEPAPATP